MCPNMKLNPIGNGIKREYEELGMKYKNINCNEYIITPNHIHGIVEILENKGVIYNAQDSNAPKLFIMH